MKKNFLLLNLTIFVIMITITSCGDSELFDEPVMYKTRATRSIDTGVEPGGEWVIKDSGSATVKKDLGGMGTATVTFSWSGGATPGTTTLNSNCTITLNNPYYYREYRNDLATREGFHDNKPRALYNIEILEKIYDERTGNVRDTIHKFHSLEFMDENQVELEFKPHDSNLYSRAIKNYNK